MLICRWKIVFLLATIYSFGFLHAAHYELAVEDIQARFAVRSSIKNPTLLSQSLSKVVSCASWIMPSALQSAADQGLAYVISWMQYSEILRRKLAEIIQPSQSELMNKYDNIVGIHHKIPSQGLSPSQIYGLIDAAAQERASWSNGRLLQAIYDGSEKHEKVLAHYYSNAIKYDELNKPIFKDDAIAQGIAIRAFERFQTSNPLHGATFFPLAQKSMQEIGAMLASVVEKKHAVVTSSGQEALRLSVRALKIARQCTKKNPCSMVVIDDDERIALINRSLHVSTIKKNHDDLRGILTHVDAAILNLSTKNMYEVKNIISILDSYKWKIHVHASRDLFHKILTTQNLSPMGTIFDLSLNITSVSFDTEGTIYNGISAVIFKDSWTRFQSIEAYLDWHGGLYAALNSAGSISGVDYIIAYLLMLHQGKTGMIQRYNESFKFSSSDGGVDISEKIPQIRALYERESSKDLALALENLLSTSGQSRHDMAKRGLLDIALSMFNAPKEYSGALSSGGSESIRYAIINYVENYRDKHRLVGPIILMSETAHVAFIRQGLEIDADIIVVKNDDNFAMDILDLKQKIKEHGKENIAAIIASIPSYSMGAYDDVEATAQIAQENDIPLHIDGCLGAFVNQYIEDNPVRIDLSQKKYNGITSVSADNHKYGYAPKGLATFIYRKDHFKTEPKSLCQSRSSTHCEVGLACMLHIGKSGFKQRSQNIVNLARRLRDELDGLPDLEILAKPKDGRTPHFVIAFRLKGTLADKTYTLADLMKKLDWHLVKVSNQILHVAITSAHVNNPKFLAKFMSDMKFSLGQIKSNPHLIQSSSAAAYGMAGTMKNVGGNLAGGELLTFMVKLYAESIMGYPRQ